MKKEFWIISLAFILFGAIIIYLESPFGSIAGQIALKGSGKFIASYDLEPKDKVYALAIKNEIGKQPLERGVWVENNGHFKINKLPVGEYTLRIKAPNYGTYNEYGLYVADGQTAVAKNIVLTPIEPWASLGSNTRVFNSQEKPYFWINASGAQKAIVKIYKTDILQLRQNKDLELSAELNLFRPNKEPSQIFDQNDLIHTLERELKPDYTDWARADFKLEKPLPMGDYIAVLEIFNSNGKKNWNVLCFSVSDLGLIIKAGPEKVLIRAINLNTLKPVDKLDLKILEQAKTIASFKTNAQGLAVYPFKEPKQNYNFLVYANTALGKAYSGMSFWGNAYNTYKTYFYTERPIYRLGQTVYYKGLVRKLTGDNFNKAQINLPIKLSASDPDGNEIWKGNLKTNKYGTFNGLFEIPLAGKTGGYQFTITYPDGYEYSDSFEVAQYKKPEFKVEVVPLAGQVVAGNKIKARLKAEYYFGSPVANAQVKYSVYSADDWSTYYRLKPRPANEQYYDDWLEENYDDPYYAGDYLSEGEVSTDENGMATIEIDTEALETSSESENTINKQYKIQAEVSDLSQSTVVSSAKVLVTAGDFALFIQPANYVYKAGETISAQISALDFKRQPIKNQEVLLKLIYWAKTKKEGEYKSQIIKEITNLKTNEEGEVSAQIALPESLNTNNYYLQAQAKDSEGHLITNQSSIWITDDKQQFFLNSQEAEKQALAIKLDKMVYKPAEIAKAMITAPITGKEGLSALITLEANGIKEYKIVPLKASAQLLEIPILDSYAPNIYLSIAFAGSKRQFYTATEMLKVSPENHFVKVQIEADKTKYKPGETANYIIKAFYPNGQPAKDMEFSLGVVDESIYAIRSETASNLQKFFYAKRENAVITLCSFPEQYSGGPDKIEPRLRKDFRDMAAWFPVLITDSKGIAKASFKLPDNLTSWRATARGINANLDLGEAIQNITTSQDILVRLALPRFFTQYDQSFISAIVHNYSDQTQNINLALEPSEQFEIKDKLQTTLKIASGEAKKYNWPVKINKIGEGILQIKAVGQTSGDALERKLPIRALGMQGFAVKAGSIPEQETSTNIEFKLAKDALSPNYNLSLAADSIGSVLGGFKKLIDYPYGCTEQTMSRLVPAVIAMRLNQNLNLKLATADQKKFDEVYKEAIIKLKDYHNADGGWGWWKNDSSNLYLTGYVLEGLYLLRQANYAVDNDLIDSGLKWLKGSSLQIYTELQNPKKALDKTEETEYLLDLAQAEYVLNLFGRDNLALKEIKNFWAQHSYGLKPETLAFLALARQENAYRNLIIAANRSEEFINWDKSNDYNYKFTPVEITALALRAVLINGPDNKETIEKIKNWLLIQRDKDGWQNTKTTAQVLRALAEEEILNKAQNPSQEVQVSTNLSSDIFQLALYQPETNLNILPKKNITITKTGSGRLYFASLLTYIMPLKPHQMFAVKAQPEGLSISRAFYRLQATKEKNKIVFKPKPLLGGQIKAGEIILMKTTIQSPMRLPYLLIEAPLPSGAEIVQNDSRENLIKNEEDWRNIWWSHLDVLDDKLAYFVSSLPSGKAELDTLLRMELAGTFQINPVQLEGMYTKQIRAYSGLSELKVKEDNN